MKKHINTEHGGKKCQFCDKKFHSNSLQTHIEVVHEKKKPHMCHVCGNGFCTNSGLVSHIRSVHTFEKPYLCKMCNGSFYTSGERLKHNCVVIPTKYKNQGRVSTVEVNSSLIFDIDWHKDAVLVQKHNILDIF